MKEKVLNIILKLVKTDKLTIEEAITLINELYGSEIDFTKSSEKSYIDIPYDPEKWKVYYDVNNKYKTVTSNDII